jgi:hypothetical protein
MPLPIQGIPTKVFRHEYIFLNKNSYSMARFVKSRLKSHYWLAGTATASLQLC